MAETRIPVKTILRNDTAANWTTANPILLKGECGLELDTLRLKFGDGVKAWNELPYFTLDASAVTGLGTASTLDSGVDAGNVPVLDENGKLNTAVIPAIAMTETFEVASEAEMLALEAQPGDVAIRSDISKTFILKSFPAASIENWALLKTPTEGVLSVNGKTGVVSLNTDDVSEGGTHKYFTNERAAESFRASIAETSVSALKDGGGVLMKTDTLILNGGNASG